MGTKTCCSCDITKPLTDFVKQDLGAQGVTGSCKPCLKARKQKKRDQILAKQRAWYAANIDEVRAKARASHALNRADRNQKRRARKLKAIKATASKRAIFEPILVSGV